MRQEFHAKGTKVNAEIVKGFRTFFALSLREILCGLCVKLLNHKVLGGYHKGNKV